MSAFIMALVFSGLVALFMRWNYRGHIEDLRAALEHERKMRRYEESRAEVLSDALFGREPTQQQEKLKN